jgi:hypothetical protein
VRNSADFNKGRGSASAVPSSKGLGRAAAVVFVALSPLLVACGASIQAIYEGDVRFEHCMALDSRPDGKPTIRKACWQEWVKFYTFGQTRDRVEYARLRAKQLSAASDFDEGEWVSDDPRTASAVPDPTNALAPPPMMLTVDGGGAETGAAPPLPPPEVDKAPPSADCAAECEESWNFCRQECKVPACEKSCMGKYKRCMRRCF